jgi:hypothetical protein
MPSRKSLSYSIIALAGLAAPFEFQVEDGRIRLPAACASSFDCDDAMNYICIKDGQELINQACLSGCGS